LQLWSYYHRFFESEWEELVSYENDSSSNLSVLEIAKALLIRPIRFGKANSSIEKEAINIILETQTQFKQFQFLKSEIEQRFGGYNLIVINPILKSRIDSGISLVDATQKFNLEIYCRSILHFVFLWLSLSRFKAVCNRAPEKRKILKFLSKAVYDHLYWRSFFRKYISEIHGQKTCFLAFKGEKYPMRTIMREVTLEKQNFVSIQHGFIGAARKYKFANPSVYFVWSDYFKDQLRSSGVKSKIEISGNLQYQGSQKPLLKSKPVGKVIFLPNSGNSTTPEREVRWATRTFLSISKLRNLPFKIYIKPHPGDSRGLVEEEMHKFREENPETDFYWLEPTAKLNFEEYDTVVTMNSTTSIEANLFATTSLILLSSPKEFLLPDLIAYDPSLMVHSGAALADKLLSIRSDIYGNSKRARENSNKFFGQAVEGSTLICQTLQNFING
jgi:hypothetical protein